MREISTTHINIKTDLQPGISEPEIREYLKVPVSRIFQEAMNNAAKHSHTNSILANIRDDEDKIKLAIRDDRTGFELADGLAVNSRGKGLGLFTMRDVVLAGSNFGWLSAKRLWNHFC